MTDWNMTDLEKWDRKISKLAESYGLDWYEIDYEMCDYYDMIGNMAYTGMPSHYKHWSFGKSFERTHFFYNVGVSGLPYEMIINADPSISYLMRENSTYMHILTMAHCIGHSDFFKNNNTFKDTDAKNVIGRFKNAANRIKAYMEDPSIGIENVENILDAAHSIKFQCDRNLMNCRNTSLSRGRLLKKIKEDKDGKYQDFDIEKIPLEPDYNVLKFIRDNSRNLEEWEKDVISIVIEEANYFIPQAKTKIMNEGWASFWHYKLLNELELPQEYHIPFIKSHNQVIRPHLGAINPYHLGFYLFKKIEKNSGLDECFFAREVYNDESFLREYLDEDDCKELNLFSYVLENKDFVIEDISDEDGWKKVKNHLIASVGLNSIPKVYVDEIIREDHTLIVRHEFDDRELDLEYAEMVCFHIRDLWRDKLRFFTTVEEEDWEI